MGSFPRAAVGRARVNPRWPQAFAICDKCGFRWNHSDLRWAFEWAGSQLQNRRFLVCSRCLDIPNPQLRAYAVPADPVPISNPRPETADMSSSFTPYLTDENGNLVTDEFGHPIVIQQPIGPPGPGPAPPEPPHNLIPLRDDDGTIILDDSGQPIMVEG